MKESVTTFDLEAAFKALDDIEVPKVSGGVAPNRLDLQENLKRRSKFDALMEEYYDVNDTQDLEEAQDAREGEIAQAKLARIEKIVDLDAESSEDLLTSYVGKFIVQCPQCMTLFYKNPEDIEGSEDAEVVNVSEVCQHCGNDTGYSIIGKVGEVEPEEVEETAEEEIPEEEIPVEEPEEEVPVEEESSEEDFDLDLDIDDLEAEEEVEESVKTPTNTPLVESITEDFEEVSDAEFEELLSDPEFKKPVSDEAVSGMVQKLEGDGEELEEGIFDFLKTEAGKADYVLKNARKDYRVFGHTSDNADGVPEDDEKNKLYKRYLVIAYDNKYASDKSNIDSAPESDENLTTKKKLPFGEYKKAADYAKSWSAQSKNGPASVYLEKPNGETVFVTRFFKGAKATTQVEALFKEVQDEITKAKKAPKDEKKQQNADNKAKQAQEKAEDKIQVTPEEFGEKIGKKYKVTVKFPEPVDPMVKEFESNEFAKAAKTAEVHSKSSIEPAVVTFDDGDAEKPEDIIVAFTKGKCTANNMKKIYIKLTQSEDTDEGDTDGVEESFKPEGLTTIMETLSDINEESLEECIANALTKVYSNVESFKLDNCNYLNEAFEVEGTIKFKSGKTRATKYSFAEAVQENNRVQFTGSNAKLAADGVFKLTGHIESGVNCLYTESFEYKYTVGETLVEGLATK